jgi:hypothetical protein
MKKQAEVMKTIMGRSYNLHAGGGLALIGNTMRPIPGGVGNAAPPYCRAAFLHRLTPAATKAERPKNTANERRGYSAGRPAPAERLRYL